jgi:glycosyltransferase involved in cell wall biosynthesis
VANGINPDQWWPAKSLAKNPASDGSEIRLLFVGRLSPEKGVHVLLDAFKNVVRSYPQARLVLVGPEGSADIDFIVNISADEQVRRLAAFYGQDYLSQLKRNLPPEVIDRITFTGFVPHDRLGGYYHDADILINPSLSESFGRSLIEAMAGSIPVIASRAGGMPEIVEDGITGLLVEPNDSALLAKAILRLIGDREMRTRMGQAGRQRAVERYSWGRVAATLMENYQRIYEQ